jgi:hypothetical protein
LDINIQFKSNIIQFSPKMIEISNTFLLVWLVVLALICIYLLYMSLTRNSETDSLKSSITNLVRQNKKRDELINFLMERVETLTNAVNSMAQLEPNNKIDLREQQDNAEKEVVNSELPPKNTELNLDDVLNSISLPSHSFQDTTKDLDTQNNIMDAHTPQTLTTSEFPEEISHSEFGKGNHKTEDTVIDNTDTTNFILKHEWSAKLDKPVAQAQQINLDDVLQSIPTTFKDDDLISTILGADDSASQQGEEYQTNEPPGKIRLLGMNVKQLKQIAKDMNIKSRGNKTDLVESIWAKMNNHVENNGLETQYLGADTVCAQEQNEIPLPELQQEQTNIQTLGQPTEDTIPEINVCPRLMVEDLPDDI